MNNPVTRGNVFADIGFAAEEAADLAMRVYLIDQLWQFIEKHGMTQARAAEFFGIPRPKISYIKHGKISEFSIDALVRLLAKTGGELRYSFKQPTKKAAQARLDDRQL